MRRAFFSHRSLASPALILLCRVIYSAMMQSAAINFGKVVCNLKGRAEETPSIFMRRRPFTPLIVERTQFRRQVTLLRKCNDKYFCVFGFSGYCQIYLIPYLQLRHFRHLQAVG